METTSDEKPCVFELITALCNNVAGNSAVKKQISQRTLASKMRSQAYEVLLKKSDKVIPHSSSDSMTDLWAYYYVLQSNSENLSDYKRATELKAALEQIKHKDFGANKELIHNVLKMLVLLSGQHKDCSSELYQQSPFSFGMLNEMLPQMKREPFGSPQPYPYYPSHIFELPFSLKHRDMKRSNHKYTDYVVETFESKSLLPRINAEHEAVEIKSLMSHMSQGSPGDSTIFNHPRLTMPRELQLLRDSRHKTAQTPKAFGMFDLPPLTSPRDLTIPKCTKEPIVEDSSFKCSRLMSLRDLKKPRPDVSKESITVTFAPSDTNKDDVKEVFRAIAPLCPVDIWEVASRMDRDIPDDIWDVVSKLPASNQRDIIATSRREMALWRQKYSNQMSRINVISERELIRHLMYLMIGVETKSFYCGKDSIFFMKENLILECISKNILENFLVTVLDVGTYFKRLHDFAFGEFHEPNLDCPGLITEAVKDAIRRYLLEFRMKATDIFEGCFTEDPYASRRLPTLLQIMYHVESLAEELATVAKIMKMSSTISPLPEGGDLLSYLYKNTSIVTQKEASIVAFTLLFSVCKVYFKFIEKFIFEGDLEDLHGEFFIKTDPQYINSRSKKYWDSGFFISFFQSIPEFLKDMTKCILLCGKTLRLFKLCNPGDPLALLISSDHPRVKCCSSFEELQRQQQILDVYRTRCMFVSGERVTFEQILLKREAERKAFTELASLKQAETMEKIVAERKRLAQLIMAEKQHSFKVLEAAMREAEAAKNKRTKRQKLITKLEREADRIAEEVDAKLVEGEKNKIMEYYSKLNMEVEKSQRHTEWKIKRLQLNQSRIQLLSTEERNLKHEKLELEHTNTDCMSMSVQSDVFFDARSHFDTVTSESALLKSVDSAFDFERHNKSNASYATPYNGSEDNVLQNRLDFEIDVITQLDKEGNILPELVHSNETSSAAIGDHLNSNVDNLQYLKNRRKALINKQRVLNSELTDRENNITDVTVKLPSVDEENNIQDGSPDTEARRNKRRVLGDDFNKEPVVKTILEPRTEAQKEALINKQKVLGVEYNLKPEPDKRRDPQNFAQEEALKNRKKILDCDSDLMRRKSDDQGSRRAGLKLDLKVISEPILESPITPFNIATTPNTANIIGPNAEFPRLDIETPTTAEIPQFHGTNMDTLKSQSYKDIPIISIKSKKPYDSASTFNFSLLDDDIEECEVATDSNTYESATDSPFKKLIVRSAQKKSSINFFDGTYNLANIDPFGLKQLKSLSEDRLDGMGQEISIYEHPVSIMEQVILKPSKNIFAKHFGNGESDEIVLDCSDIATLTACLRRSVMLPLSYQLEVVNNAILSHFLVNLDMYEHLRSLKDYFFLGDGEFSRSICHNLFTKLKKTINPDELLNFASLHNILDKALGSSISHINKFSENLSFAIGETPLSFHHSSPDVLQCISLTYAVEWPLNIILSNEALARYAKVFQFLIKMRRIAWVLGEDFEVLKQLLKLSRNKRNLQRSPQYITLQLYRHNMASLIRALDSYIITTSIQSSWNEFENDLKKARTLDDLYECHVVYVKKVLFRCLLNNRSTPVMSLLNDMFTVVLKFSRVLQAGKWNEHPEGHFTHQCFYQMEELYHIFEKLTNYLHTVISKLMEYGYQRHLAELLTMINLNGYYDRSKYKPNKSLASNVSVAINK